MDVKLKRILEIFIVDRLTNSENVKNPTDIKINVSEALDSIKNELIEHLERSFPSAEQQDNDISTDIEEHQRVKCSKIKSKRSLEDTVKILSRDKCTNDSCTTNNIAGVCSNIADISTNDYLSAGLQLPYNNELIYAPQWLLKSRIDTTPWENNINNNFDNYDYIQNYIRILEASKFILPGGYSDNNIKLSNDINTYMPPENGHIHSPSNSRLTGFKKANNLPTNSDSNDAEKRFVCEQKNCQKRFANKFLLKKHQFIHTGLRPHMCPFCNKRFNRKDNLLRHKKTHYQAQNNENHSINVNQDVLKSQSSTSSLAPTSLNLIMDSLNIVQMENGKSY